ncbi:MAG: Serine/threonine protein kinase PrkC, regulator of stationary phase [Myxococcales bacterium]|nr:Serine/threonine protein kinase PrkC, regulator of stationary phase [Myxococcales bacterium]
MAVHVVSDPPLVTAAGAGDAGAMDDDDTSRASVRWMTPPERVSTVGIEEIVVPGQRYQLGDMLGRGGMGEVFDAEDKQIGRGVAIKRLRSEAPSEKQIARFMREARIQGRLEHPAIVPVHELGRDADGRPYFAMKKLAGTTLADILKLGDGRDAKYPRQRLLRALADVCLAVELAHTRGFVHRDLKPDNIMLGDFGETYVLDWGVAKVNGEDDTTDASSVDEGASTLVTAAGALVGTPGYMAPEQVHGVRDIDGRADVYALGSVLFEILAGERLHATGKSAAMSTTVAGIPSRPSLRRPDAEIPPELDELTAAALHVDREARIATARALGERIQKYLDGDRDLALRRSLAKEHLDHATVAFAGGDRSRAMREAGRALALDPTLHAAGELITRMMLEPPKILPPEVKKAFDHESADVVRRTTTVGAIASATYLGFVPLLAIVGNATALQLAIITFAAGASVVMLLWMRRPGTKFITPALIAAQLLLLVLITRLFSPFFLGPGLAAVTAIGFMTGPQYAKRQASWVFVVTALSVIGPWLLEQAGLVASTITVFSGGLTVHSSLVQSESSFYIVMIAYTLTLIFSGVLLTRGLRLAERHARQHMHLQAWQLSQLVARQAD